MFKKILVDLHAEIEMPRPYWYCRDLEATARLLESDARELTEFIHDHRSKDSYVVSIVREYKELCSFCGSEKELDADGCPVCCTKAIEEFENSKPVRLVKDE